MSLTSYEKSKLIQVHELILKDLSRPLSITELCMTTGLSKTKLEKGFKEIYAHPVYAYQLQMRMNLARDLLVKGYLVKEVASHTGYADTKAFTRMFKKIMGEPPRSYRYASL